MVSSIRDWSIGLRLRKVHGRDSSHSKARDSIPGTSRIDDIQCFVELRARGLTLYSTTSRRVKSPVSPLQLVPPYSSVFLSTKIAQIAHAISAHTLHSLRENNQMTTPSRSWGTAQTR